MSNKLTLQAFFNCGQIILTLSYVETEQNQTCHCNQRTAFEHKCRNETLISKFRISRSKLTSNKRFKGTSLF